MSELYLFQLYKKGSSTAGTGSRQCSNVILSSLSKVAVIMMHERVQYVNYLICLVVIKWNLTFKKKEKKTWMTHSVALVCDVLQDLLLFFSVYKCLFH